MDVRFGTILRRLADQQLDFVVIGGVAAALHGSPVATSDVDVCIAFNDMTLPKIIAALQPLNPRLRHRPDKMPLPTDLGRLRGVKNLYLLTDLGLIDLLGELPGVGSFDDLAGRTITMDLGGFSCRVLDLETLIQAKTLAGRGKDLLGVRHLEAIRKHLRDNPPLFPPE